MSDPATPPPIPPPIPPSMPPPVPGSAPPPIPDGSAAPAQPAAAPPPPETAPPEAAPVEAGPGMLTSTCPSCGAQTTFAPGTTVLRCSSCGAERTIAAQNVQIREHSFDEWVAANHDLDLAGIAATTLRCQNCGATTETADLAGVCQFCSGALIVVDLPAGLVRPEGLVPFGVDQRAAQANFKQWVGSRWFAPNGLKRIGGAEGLRGTYVPHWTYDAQTETDYEGRRGDYYYTTHTRQVSDGKGGTRTETYQQRHTRWRHAEGHVARFFDDVLVSGSHRFDPKFLQEMGPWRLDQAVPYQPDYLTGYSALRYDIDPEDAAVEARAQMHVVVEQDARHDIGGDEQEVHTLDIAYRAATFKLLLFPLWMAAYAFGGKTFSVMVNANTGEVVGERPYSAVKIAAAVVAALVLVGIVVALVALNRSS